MASADVALSESRARVPCPALRCSVRHRSIAITGAGAVRQHGPVRSRCPGSGQPPALSGPGSIGLDNGRGISTPPTPSLLSSAPPLRLLRPSVKILKRIPRAPRELSGKKLPVILEAIVRNNDCASWDRLLRFGARCLRHPRPVRGGRRCWSLATGVNSQLQEEADPPAASPPTGSPSGGSQSSPPNPIEFLASRVSLKLEEGDFRGAVRLACSEDTLADSNEATFAALQQRHPPPHPASVIPPRPQPPLGVPTGPLVDVLEEEVACAIQSFPKGSAGGPDGLRPQHLKDMIKPSANGGRQALLSSLTLFIKLVLEGDVQVCARPYFFGANFVALELKDGGVRPIAVGCTQRRLVAKVAGRGVMKEMGALLFPWQPGYGVKKGAEATVHAARLYLHSLDPSNAILKLDFKNALNSIRKDKMLEAVQRPPPQLFSFVHSAYSSPSSLFWKDRVLQSAEGVQQGDPLGLLLFCLTIHQL